MKNVVFILFLFLVNSYCFSQKTMKIIVEENNGGNVNVSEQNFDITGLSEEEVTKIQEKYIGQSKSKDKKVKITIDEKKESSTELFDDQSETAFFKSMPRGEDMTKGMRIMSEKILKYGSEVPDKFKDLPENTMFWNDGKMKKVEDSAPIKSLDVFPNNPDRNVINVKFYAPFEGTINIVITDVLGNKVESKEIEKFKGLYTDQIVLKKNTTGTFFVLVSQNGDGISKRIVL